MSTLPSNYSGNSAVWKEEVNRRVAAHKNRKGPARVEPEQLAPRPAASRAAEVLARVNARYAKAPSYNQFLAAEARAQLRPNDKSTEPKPAEPLAQALALQPGFDQAAPAVHPQQVLAAELALPEMDLAQPEVEIFAEAAPHEPALAYADPTPLPEPPVAYAVRWAEILPEHKPEPAAVAGGQTEIYELVPEGWREPGDLHSILEPEAIEVVEAGNPIPGNLIQFPREIVAPRRLRTRSGEPEASDYLTQLSIFEVDPASVELLAAPASMPTPEVFAEIFSETQEWVWRPIEQPELPAAEPEPGPETFQQPSRSPKFSHQNPEASLIASRQAGSAFDPAPISLRIMAGLVNVALVATAVLAASVTAVQFGYTAPGPRSLAVCAAAVMALIGFLYTALFYFFSDGTPGMHYAHLRLTTFDGRKATRLDRITRLMCIVLSLLPLGLGLVWMLFDEEHLCWHDRLSRTVLRRY